MANAFSSTVTIGALEIFVEGFAESDSSDADLSTAGDVVAAGTACECGSVSAGILIICRMDKLPLDTGKVHS